LNAKLVPTPVCSRTCLGGGYVEDTSYSGHNAVRKYYCSCFSVCGALKTAVDFSLVICTILAGLGILEFVALFFQYANHSSRPATYITYDLFLISKRSGLIKASSSGPCRQRRFQSKHDVKVETSVVTLSAIAGGGGFAFL